jgi:hypothetical protein
VVSVRIDTTAVAAGVGAGWFVDPFGVHELRWFDGRQWSGHVTHFGPVPCEACCPVGLSGRGRR